MRGNNAKTACLNEACQLCQGCKQQPHSDISDFDEWTMLQDVSADTNTEDYVNLDRAIEVATLAG